MKRKLTTQIPKALSLLALVLMFSALKAQTYYWVGGAGDWHDYGSHWATTSGGASFHSQAPQSFNDVIFDTNSGFLLADKVNHSNVASAVCHDMTWSTGIADVGMTSSSAKVLDVYGSLLFEVGQDMDGYRGKLRFLSTGTETIEFKDNFTRFDRIIFEPQNGSYTVLDDIDQHFAQTGHGGILVNIGTGDVTFQDTVKCEGLYEGIHVASGTATFNDLVWGYSPTNRSPIFGKNVLWLFRVSGGTVNFNHETWIYWLDLDNGDLNAQNTTQIWGQVGGTYADMNGSLDISNSLIECERWWGITNGSMGLNTTNSTINIYKSFSTKGHVYNNVIAKEQMVYNPSAGTIDTLICEKGMKYINGAYGLDSIVGLMRWHPGNYGIPTSSYTPEMYLKNTCKVEILGDCENWVVNNGIDFIFEGFTTGSLVSDYMRLESANASGPGAPYNAGANSYVVSNSSNWTVGAPAPRTLTWQGPIVAASDVANYGDWHDMNSWSITGGSPATPNGTACPPTMYDSVVFPANSFVRIRELHANCKSMNWLSSGVLYDSLQTNSRSLRTLEIYGSLNFSTTMVNNFESVVTFRTWETYPTITSNGKHFNYITVFNAIDNLGEWHLTDSMSVPNSYRDTYVFNLTKGNFHTEGFPLTIDNFYAMASNGQSMNMYDSDIWVYADPTRYNARMWMNKNIPQAYMNSGTSHIHFLHVPLSGNTLAYFGTNQTFYDITFKCAKAKIYRNGPGTAYYHNVTFEQGGEWYDYYSSAGGTDNIHKLQTNTVNDSTQDFTLATYGYFNIDSAFYHGNTFLSGGANYNNIMKLYPGKAYDLLPQTGMPGGSPPAVQTLAGANVLDANGNCVDNIIIDNGSFYSTGNQTADYCIITNNTASSATFAYTNCNMLGTTTGWTGIPTTPRTLYWVDITPGVSKGEWNDMLSWSLTDGGIGGNCPPSSIDTVIFTNLSFTGNDTVNIDLNTLPALCADMRWETTTVIPVFSGGPEEIVNVHASLLFSTSMLQDFQGGFVFKTDSMNQTITSKGQTFNNFAVFNGNGEWTLLDDFRQNQWSFNNTYSTFLKHHVQLLKGKLNTNNKTMEMNNFVIASSDNKEFNVGTSELIIVDGRHVTWQWGSFDNFYVRGSNLTLDADSSHIRFVHQYYSTYNGFNDVTLQNNVWNDITFKTLSGGLVSGNVRGDGCFFGKIEFSRIGEIGRAANEYMTIRHLKGTHTTDLIYVRADSCVFDSVSLAGPARIYQDNYYNDLVDLSAGKTYTFESGRTQHIDNDCRFVAVGSAGNEIQLYSSIVGQETYLRKDSGLFCISYFYMRDMHAIGDGISTGSSCTTPHCDTIIADSFIPSFATSGRADFNAGINANDQGNNAGWDFSPLLQAPNITLINPDVEICPGDSVLLTFEAIGVAPFDVTYYDSIPGNTAQIIDSLNINTFTSGDGSAGSPYVWEFYAHPTVSGQTYSLGFTQYNKCFSTVSYGIGDVTITINGIPVASTDNITLTENDPLSYIDVQNNDVEPDGEVMTTTIISGPTSGAIAIVINNDSIAYTPITNWCGLDTIIYSVCDACPNCDIDTVLINIICVNGAPDANTDYASGTEDDTNISIDIQDNDTDPENDVLTTTILSGPSSGGTVTIVNNDSLSYTPPANFCGADTIVYQVCDGGALCDQDTVFITIACVNDGPIVDNEIISTPENNAVSGDLTDAGDYDIDGNLVVTVLPTAGPSNGTIVINPDGTYTYTPNNGFLGVDTVVVTICDDGSPTPIICTTDTIFITVNPCVLSDALADCDNDGLTNGEETTGVDDPSTPNNPNGNTTDPLNPDTDGDGVTDGDEAGDNTDPNLPCDLIAASVTLTPASAWNNLDCDNDGLTNGEELNGIDDPSTPNNPNGNTTDPLDPDTDGDGVTDGDEAGDNTDPNLPCDFIVASQTVTPSAPWNALDCDNDGLTNGEEYSGVDDGTTPNDPNGNTSNPLVVDTDGDGVNDNNEAADGTVPTDPCDLDLTSVTLTPSVAWGSLDCDNDGLTNNEELTGVDDPSTPNNPNGNTTDPLNPDSDGDGVTDGDEAGDNTDPNLPCDLILASQTLAPNAPWNALDCDNDGLTNNEELTGTDDGTTPNDPNGNTTDPLNPDTDGDGVTDGDEAGDSTDPNVPCDYVVGSVTVAPSTAWNALDCDNDGLTNGEELTGIDDASTPNNPNGNTTDPNNPDTDGDGVTDGDEAGDNTDPNLPCDLIIASQTLAPNAPWSALDCDNDGLTNNEELTGTDDGTTPNDPNGNTTDPLNPDTDGDGVTDGDEAGDNTDPNLPCDFLATSVTLTPSSAWNDEDCDNDGLTNGEELTGVDDPATTDNPNGNTTDPFNPDSDGDGVIDGTEGTDLTDPNDPCELVMANQTVAPNLAWNALDCDNDGLTNGEEVSGVDDPATTDVPNGNTTDPLNPDSDGDGVTDGTEGTDLTDPNNPCELLVASITLSPSGTWNTADCDGDGVTNADEIADNTIPTNPCDFILTSQTVAPSATWNNADCDNDGLTNGEELTGIDDPTTPNNPNGYTSDPLVVDTDGDGVTDGDEAGDGTDPNNPCDLIIASQTVAPNAAWNSADCDTDGLTNEEELTGVDDPTTPNNPNGNTTDPLVIDTDGDGVTDGDEAGDTTDPNNPCDYVIASQTVTPSAAWSSSDCDNDGLTNGEELTGIDDPSTPNNPNGNTSDPLNPDTDGDGVTDGDEAGDNTDPNNPCELVIASQTVTPSTTWSAADCDNDGLTNGEELTGSTDPLNPDTDGDGVIDGTEITDGTVPTDPCDLILANQTVTPSATWSSADCDNDGLTNGEETTGVDDPSTPNNPNGNTSNPFLVDTDGDGVTDNDEAADGTDPNDPCDYEAGSISLSQTTLWNSADCDNDGLTNGEELTGVDDPSTPNNPNGNTSDPLNPDTDGDGVTDGDEAGDGTDPNNPCDYVVASITLETTVSCGVSIPEGFSPNDDGVNDQFVIRGINNYSDNTLIIMNRWGNTVFKTEGYQNDWDGTNQQGGNIGGNNLPVGTYFYILEINTDKSDVDKINKGYIYLNR